MKKIPLSSDSLKSWKRRAKYGLAEEDTWSLNNYILLVIANGLEYLSEHGSTYSYEFYGNEDLMKEDYKNMSVKFRKAARDEEYAECLEWLNKHFEYLWD